MERTIRSENSMVTGVIWKQLLLFFFPIMLGSLFQQLYNTVDAIVVGKFVGTGIFASFRIDYQFTFGQEFVDHAHCSFHISSCVAT